MKIARIVMTATILFSLKSTLFCSASEQAIVVDKAAIPVVRRKSHDGTRDGRFGSAADTFKKLGQIYKGPFGIGEEQIYALGSDEGAPMRWAHFGKTITNVADAKKWVKAVEEKGWNLPTECMQPALDLIQADREDKIAKSKIEFTQKQEATRALIASITELNTKRTSFDQERNQFYAQEIRKITDAKIIEFTTRNQERSEENEKICQQLKTLLEDTKIIRLAHNEQYPENPIVAAPIIIRSDINQINKITLATIAARYDAAIKAAAQK